MRNRKPTTPLTPKQKEWAKRQELYSSHPIYKEPLVRKICDMFDGKVVEVNGEKLD